MGSSTPSVDAGAKLLHVTAIKAAVAALGAKHATARREAQRRLAGGGTAVSRRTLLRMLMVAGALLGFVLGLLFVHREEVALFGGSKKPNLAVNQLGMPLPAGQRPVVVGHIHIAKTAGTSINGMAANEFERVCGNKGYSFDFFESNRRHKAGSMPGTAHDSVHEANKAARGQDRQRVPSSLMHERGFKDCDWISAEASSQVILEQCAYIHPAVTTRSAHAHEQFWQTKAVSSQVTELHVPCREPISHLFSVCNHVGSTLDRSSHRLLKKSAQRCLRLDPDHRFSTALLSKYTVRCYPFEQMFDRERGYLHWLGRHLQHKSEHEPYHRLDTNTPHHDLPLSEPDREMLVGWLTTTYEYYKFCSSCSHSWLLD